MNWIYFAYTINRESYIQIVVWNPIKLRISITINTQNLWVVAYLSFPEKKASINNRHLRRWTLTLFNVTHMGKNFIIYTHYWLSQGIWVLYFRDRIWKYNSQTYYRFKLPDISSRSIETHPKLYVRHWQKIKVRIDDLNAYLSCSFKIPSFEWNNQHITLGLGLYSSWDSEYKKLR